MKVLIVNNHYADFGGAETLIKNCDTYLNHLGFQIFFFSSKEKNKELYFNPDYKYIKYFPEFNSGVKSFLKHPFNYYFDNNSKNKFKLILETIQPDIVHLHTIGHFTNSILNCLENIPTIMTIHSAYHFFCPNTQAIRNGQICSNCKNGNYLPCIYNSCGTKGFEQSLRIALKAYINYKHFKNIDYFISPSEALRNYVLKISNKIDERDIKTIPNYLTKEKRNTIPHFSNDNYFLYAGRLTEVKGIQYLLQALLDLPQNIKFHIAGTGDYEKELKQFVKNNNLTNVKFLGHLNSKQLNTEYQNCIATILPCNWFEIFGLTNIESFINGKPVIASNIGGIPEIVEHNVNGLLFEPGNVEQLKECILKYWNNPELVIEHGKNGYKKAKENYTEEKYYEEIIKVYNHVLDKYKGINNG